MTEDGEAMARAVLDDPDDAAPRLILADWHEERGTDAAALRADGSVMLSYWDYDAAGNLSQILVPDRAVAYWVPIRLGAFRLCVTGKVPRCGRGRCDPYHPWSIAPAGLWIFGGWKCWRCAVAAAKEMAGAK